MNPFKCLWNILIIQSCVHHHQCHDEYNDLYTNDRNTCILEQIHRDMHNVKIRELDFHLAMVVYDGGIDAYRFTWEGYATSNYHVFIIQFVLSLG